MLSCVSKMIGRGEHFGYVDQHRQELNLFPSYYTRSIYVVYNLIRIHTLNTQSMHVSSPSKFRLLVWAFWFRMCGFNPNKTHASHVNITSWYHT